MGVGAGGEQVWPPLLPSGGGECPGCSWGALLKNRQYGWMVPAALHPSRFSGWGQQAFLVGLFLLGSVMLLTFLAPSLGYLMKRQVNSQDSWLSCYLSYTFNSYTLQKNSTLKIKGKEKYIRVQIYLQRLDRMTDSFIFRNLSKYMQQIVCYRRFCRLLWDCTLVFLNQAYDFQRTYIAQCLYHAIKATVVTTQES